MLKTTYVLLSDVAEADRNVRDHSDGDPDLDASIKRFGFIDPTIRDDRTGKLLDGHGRLHKLRQYEMAGGDAPENIQVTDKGWKIPVVTGWASRDDTEADAAAIAVQPKDGRYNEDALYKALHRQKDLTGIGFKLDDIQDLGRRLDQLAASAPNFRQDVPDEPPDDPDDPRPLPSGEPASGAEPAKGPRVVSDIPDDIPDDAPTVTVAGDLWKLGKHRLLCGDSTKRDTYRTLLGDDRPELLLTDPPYGVSYRNASSDKRAILGDLTQAAIPVGLACSLEVIDDNARLILFGGSDQFAMYLNLFDHHLRQQPRLIVWKKDNFVLRSVGFHSHFELAYYGWKGNGGGVWYGDRKVSDIWDIPRKKDTDHQTEKPIALFEIPIDHLVSPGGLVLDPFAGSGVTIIAAERLGRTAAVIEMDPHWCDVICKRWQAATGVTPVRGSTGEPVNFLDTPPVV
jgi:DNA modification methylase